MHLKKGTSLQNGRYRIESVLGQGGFGITYLAVQTGINLNRKVAIKEFFMSDFCERDPETSNVSLGTSGSRETVEKFKRKFITEACNIAKLHNPHIIRIIENFEENGTVYYVMDYIEGESLKDMLYPNKTLAEADALNYIRQVSDALAEVHANDMLHLDVKPGNIMVDSKGSVVLIDFGVSKRFDGGNGSEKLTTTTTLPYTPGYAPLEQMDQDASDLKPSADIYALGATLYRLLSGETPPTATALAGGRALPSLPSSVSPQVRRAIETAMLLNKLNRPQSVADFLALLDAPVSAVSEDTIKIPNVDESTVHEDDADKNDKTGNSVNASKVTDSKPVVVESENEKKKNKSWMLWVLIALIGIGVGLSALLVEGPSPVVVSDSDSVQVIASIVPVSVPAVESEDAPAPAVESEDVSAHTDKVDEDSLRRLQEELQAESLRIAEERRLAEEAELARQEEQRRAEEEERRLAEEAELARQEEQRRAEEEERKRQAEQRQAEERRQAEEAERKRQEEEARRQAASVTTDSRGNKTFTVNGVSFKMVAVDGGTFRMGATKDMDPDARDNERPVHDVTLSGYYIGETEVTQELWQAVMGSNPSYFTGNLQRPVEEVSWNDCRTFIGKLNDLTGGNFRLPTEAEWEYAARGGNKSRGYKYSGSDNIGDVAWYGENWNTGSTHAVKTKSPNELGIYDMSGNVCEWCQDYSGDYSSAAQTNPKGPSSGSYRVGRGGSWYFIATLCRCTFRGNYTPAFTNFNLGLRLVSQ